MKQYSIEEIIKRIRHRNNDIFKYLYKEIYPSVLKYILNSNGNDDDAKDVFQEAIIILYRKVCEPGFKLNSTIKTFLFSISKNIWYQKTRSPETLVEDMVKLEEDFSIYGLEDEYSINEKEIGNSLKISLLQKYYKQLDSFCQRILQMFYKGISHNEISKKLKISIELSRSRKKECLKKLLNMISTDPEYRKFYGV